MLVKSTQIYFLVCQQQIFINNNKYKYSESNIPTYIWFVQCICNVLLKVVQLIVGLNYHEMYPKFLVISTNRMAYWTCMKGVMTDHFMVK